MDEPTKLPLVPALVWIGIHDHPEVAEHWNHFRLSTTVHHRKNMVEFLAAPPQHYTHVIWVRLDRSPVDQQQIDEAMRMRNEARYAVLEGHLCAGLGRAEKPIQGWKRCSTAWAPAQLLHWYRKTCATKHQESIGQGSGGRPTPTSLFGLIGAPRRATDWLADWFHTQNLPCMQVTATAWRGLSRGIDTWIWDESAIQRLGLSSWQSLVQRTQSSSQRKPRHLVLTTMPSWNTKRQLITAGASSVIPKPLFEIDLTLFTN